MAQFWWISWAVCLSDQTPRPISYRQCQSSVRDRYRILLRIRRTFSSVLIITTFPEKKKKLAVFASEKKTTRRSKIDQSFFFVVFLSRMFCHQTRCVCKSVKRKRKNKKCHRPKHVSYNFVWWLISPHLFERLNGVQSPASFLVAIHWFTKVNAYTSSHLRCDYATLNSLKKLLGMTTVE